MIKAGNEVLSYCTSCRMDLNHTVIAMNGDRIAKVQCRTCNKPHAYRLPKGVDTPVKKTAARSRTAKKVVSVETEWSRLMEEHKDDPSKPYSVKQSFKPGDRVDHPKFGCGFVEKVVHPNKMEIVFQHEVKTLIHAG